MSMPRTLITPESQNQSLCPAKFLLGELEAHGRAAGVVLRLEEGDEKECRGWCDGRLWESGIDGRRWSRGEEMTGRQDC